MDFVIICRKALYFRGSLSICPAYAGMIPLADFNTFSNSNLSRVCGDDPVGDGKKAYFITFVPRMRG